MSSRSSYSVPEYETHDLSTRNNEQLERAIQYNIKEVSSTGKSLENILYLSPCFSLISRGKKRNERERENTFITWTILERLDLTLVFLIRCWRQHRQLFFLWSTVFLQMKCYTNMIDTVSKADMMSPCIGLFKRKLRLSNVESRWIMLHRSTRTISTIKYSKARSLLLAKRMFSRLVSFESICDRSRF